jgi:hypothetical protein
VTSDAVELLSAPISGLSTGALAYARTSPSDMLAHVQTSPKMQCSVGREIAIYGDFEDGDADDAFHEGAMWSQSAARYVQNSVVRSGAGAAVLLRSQSNTSPATLFMNNRIGVDPATALTLHGFVKGDNAGPFEIEVSWYGSGGVSLSSSVVYTKTAGTYAWQSFSVNLTPPASAASMAAFFRSHPPAAGEANTFLDDISLIEWGASTTDASLGFPLPTPNEWSFIRCTTNNPGLGSADLTLTHRTYEVAPAPL